MSRTFVHLLYLMTLSCLSRAEDKMNVSCPEHQRAFGGSCYEFVGLQRTFLGAQAWCEHRGGHLVFIPDVETQHFLQRHLDPGKDMWFGAAPSASTDLQYSPSVEGPLSWLDGSQITYSRWVSSRQSGAACGHILKDSGFQWEATRDCNKKLPFICQFESGRFIACAGHGISLQCGSGQALMIDGGFYGRKNIHYCRATHSPLTTPTQLQCGWVDVEETFTAHCRGRQVCLITDIMDSFDEPCPQLGSYLSLDYHCKDGLALSLSTVAAVFDDVTISVKWLFSLRPGNLTCKLSTGEGQNIYLPSPEGLGSSVVHKYTDPGVFAVTAECNSSDAQITAQKIIKVQEPIREFGVITCFASKLSFHGADCKALYGEEFQIQVEVKEGTNVTYRIQSDDILLSVLPTVRGKVPHNITVTPEMVKQLGRGCHQLTLYASNMVTFPEVSADLQVCVSENVSGLQASVLSEQDGCLDYPDITVGVTLERGAPVLLLFFLTGDNSSFSESRQMYTRKDVFHITHQIQGPVHVKLRALNAFSSVEANVNMFSSCGKDPVVKVRKKHIRVTRSTMELEAKPNHSVNKKEEITVKVKKLPSDLDDSQKYRYQWRCTNPCKCQGNFEGQSHTIEENCLPGPFEYNKYHFEVINKDDNDVEETDYICVTVKPSKLSGSTNKPQCVEGCDPIQPTIAAKMEIVCDSDTCANLAWHIEDLRDDSLWPPETKSCYKDENERPLIKKNDGGTQYTVSPTDLALALSMNKNLRVVVTNEDDDKFYYNDNTIGSSPQTTTSFPASTAAPATTTANTAASTTATTSSDISSTTAVTDDDATTAATTGDTSSSATTDESGLKCSISPQSGTVLDAFKITCNTAIQCSNCQYCFKIHEGKHLRCSGNNEVESVFLPLGDSSANYKLIITATAKKGQFVVSTTMTATVLDSSSSSVETLKASVEIAVAQLKETGQLSGEALGQIFASVGDKLNGQSDPSEKAERQKLREQMLDVLADSVKQVPSSSAAEVQMTATALNAVMKEGSELSPAAQEEASLLLVSLSSSLLHMELNSEEMQLSANVIVEGASTILDFPSTKNLSDSLLLSLTNTQSALLSCMDAKKGPAIVQKDHIGLFVQRATPEHLNTETINVPNSTSTTFTLPKIPSDVFSSDEPVDVRMLSLYKNPFSWNKSGNISGVTGSLSLTTKNGSVIPVDNLSEEIEILLPRPAGEQVNTSFLDLGNYSTTVINLPSADMALVLKMVPSSDPLPFKLFLGYKDYPTDKSHVAMTEMPHQGTTQEERYTWVLEPNILKGHTGVYYLVVRPIVGPGIKSINANLSITSITTACKFWDESKLDWNTYGCRVGVKTTHLVTQCLCTHLTFFGSSFFVTPNLVDPSRTAELFATFAENPVVVCFVGALFVVYLLAVVWARRKDLKDVAKVQVTVLEDNDPMDEYRYLLSVCTGHRRGASTSSQVTITLLGAEGHSEPHHLKDPKKCLFERGALDMFLLTTPFSLGDLQGIRLWHNNSGSHPAWYVGNVIVQDLQTKQKWHFLCNSWLAIDVGDCCLDKVCPVSSENDLKRFSNLFFMKTTRDFSDGHLWYSVVSRPASSTFTCVQRVSCCFSLLLCTMLTSIMFYGIPTDPSEQTMDLGHFEFTWQQFMVGVQSSLIMFPVNILIVSIFRNTRPRETSCCRRKTEKPDAHGQTTSIDRNVNVTLETVIRDIMKIVHTLSGTMKRNVPCADFGSRQQVDINAALSVLEDSIKQSNKPSDSSQVKAQSIHNLDQPHTPEGSDGMCPGSSMEGIQKQSNKTQYLYRQLCRIDQELILLGPSMFSNPQSYSRALQQVQSMKGSLEDQLFKFGCVNQDKVTQQKLNPADRTDGDGGQKKRVCCHGGLPWWFIFFGWLLVIATSVVAGYYTMLYGLKFGKERSISWLISMIVSFFQSVLIIQPLKVLCLAVFFALVIKSVDEEDFQNVDLIGSDTIPGEIKDKQAVRLNSSVYEPPPAADIEKMRRNQIMEQKAFALLREILTYVGFLWMLLLVAYGQRDPNAFFLNQHIRKSFSENIPESMSLGDVFTWANTTLLRNLFGVYPGFITDGNSKLVGNARLRQLRVQKSSCQIAGSMLQLVPDCHALYSWDEEDMGSYDTSWNHSVTDNTTTDASSPWGYQTQAQLRAYPIWGTMVLYRGGGFVAELGPDLQNATKTLEYLFRNKWLDMYTRAIFVEFTVYNANVNLFCIVTLLLETTAVGAFQFKSELQSIRLYQSTGGLHIFVMAAEIIYMLFILYYMFQQGKLMKQQRCAYFKSKWNLLELTIILLSWGAVAVFIKRTLTGNRDMTYYQNHKDQFASFHETATADSLLQYLIAFLVLLSTVKLWHLLRLNPKMNMITATLQRAWHDISGFLMIIVVMLVAYSIACNVIYGWKISSYRTLGDALVTIISLQIGIFNYDEVLNSSPVLGGVLFGSCIVLMTFVVLNLLLSVILVAFNQEQTYHKPSDEEEVVDLLLKKIFSLFGIRYKNTQDNPRPDVNGGSRLTPNDNTNILHNSPTDVNSKTPVRSEEL